MSNVVSLHDHQTKVWEAYVAAKAKSDQTGSASDVAASNACWSEWLSLLVPREYRGVSAALLRGMSL